MRRIFAPDVGVSVVVVVGVALMREGRRWSGRFLPPRVTISGSGPRTHGTSLVRIGVDGRCRRQRFLCFWCRRISGSTDRVHYTGLVGVFFVLTQTFGRS